MSECSKDHDSYEKNYRFLGYLEGDVSEYGYCAKCELGMLRVRKTGHLGHEKWKVGGDEWEKVVAEDKKRRQNENQRD